MIIPVGGGCGKINLVVNVNHGGTDLTKLVYADNDADAAAKGVAIKGFYLASESATIGAKYGTLVRREY